MSAQVWKQQAVATAFLHERSLLIPDRPRQLDLMLRDIGFRDVDCFWKCFELALFGGSR